jgi:rod shape-determining protein MreD
MNETTYDLRSSAESHIEVHKFRGGTIVGTLIIIFFLQAFVPKYFHSLTILDLPLLVTIYFGLSRRNPSTGLLLGMAIGLLQDSLSGVLVGFYGIAKTIIGYLASSIGARLALTVFFFGLQQGILVLERRILLAQPEVWFTTHLAVAALINAVVGVLLFTLLDRLRKPS